MADDFLTLTDLATRLGISESTARYYAERFESYIPSAGDGQEITYRPEAVEVMELIHELLSSDHRPSEIETRLARLYPRTVAVEEKSELAAMVRSEASAVSEQLAGVILPVLVRQTHTMDRIADALEQLASRSAETDLLERTADALAKLADRREESRVLGSIADSLSQLSQSSGTQVDTAVFEHTATALEELAKRDDEVRALESELQELRKAQEASDLKRRIMEARRDREQKEYYRQAEERMQELTVRKRPPWWKFWQR